MIVLSGADLVLPDRILSPGTLVVENGRIGDIRSGAAAGGHGISAFHGHYIVPGFIDVHVHGLRGIDSLDPGDPIAAIAAALPRFGVTAFCPTTVACAPGDLRRVLGQVRRAREAAAPRAARVLGAHLESNFINPDYRGAQPLECLRSPRAALERLPGRRPDPLGPATATRLQGPSSVRNDAFDAADVLREIVRGAPDVGIVTVAPELDGGLDLVHWLSERGHRVALGHSAATYEETLAAIAAGARHATHLFNRMPPLGHRTPGLAGAVLQSDEVVAEIICDGFHVHPAIVRTAIAAKRPSHVFAITDGTAAAGLPVGARASLGGQPITVGESAAYLSDGTLAGSILTMDRAFQVLVGTIGLPLIDAATLSATTPARALGLVGHGVLAPEAAADFVVLDANLSVVQTYVGGELAWARDRQSIS